MTRTWDSQGSRYSIPDEWERRILRQLVLITDQLILIRQHLESLINDKEK